MVIVEAKRRRVVNYRQQLNLQISMNDLTFGFSIEYISLDCSIESYKNISKEM